MMRKKLKQQGIQFFILSAIVIGLVFYFLEMGQWEHTVLQEKTEILAHKGSIPIHAFKTSSGTEGVVVPLPQLPLIDIVIAMDAGSARDHEQWGVAYLMGALIGQDTHHETTQTIYETFEAVGSQFSVEVSRDLALLHLRTLADPDAMNISIAMLKKILKETEVKPESFTREQRKLLTQIDVKKNMPSETIADAFYMTAYGEHPYAHPITGIPETVSSLSPSDLQNFYDRFWVKPNASIVVVGDISLEKGKLLVESLLEALPSGSKADVLPAVTSHAAVKQDILFPSSQTHWMLGLPALKKTDPDLYAVMLGNHILGGMFSSRLFKEVRDKKGLAYSVRSQVVGLRELGPFSIYLQTRQSEITEAEETARNVLQDYLAKGPTAEELAIAKENLVGGLVLSLNNNQAIAYHVANLAFYGLPWDYAATFREKVEALSQEDVAKAFAKYIHFDKMTTIILGGQTAHAP